MLDMSVQYAGERQQFGKPIGSFQAVKHHLANVAVRVEYAKAPVYRAAWSLSQHHPAAPLHASQAKLAAGNAAMLAAQNAIQVHGALGYTWEADLHLFMKKAWSLTHAYGTPPHHKHRLAAAILTPATPLGPGTTFPPL